MSRRVAVLLVAAATAAAAVLVGVQLFDAEPSPPAEASPDPSPGSSGQTEPVEALAPTLLLPNMRSLNATQLQLTETDRTRRLRFAASLANLGPGPLLLDPRGRLECSQQQIAADQLIHADGNEDGVFQRSRDRVADRRRAGCMLIHPDPDHDHWHFDAMASYVLANPQGEIIAARNKVSFCLRDNQRVLGADIVVRREHFGECGRRLVQGISPGWVDVYSADLAGQSLKIAANVTGVHCLTLTADPRQRIAETDEADNSRTIAIQISDNRVRRSAATSCATG